MIPTIRESDQCISCKWFIGEPAPLMCFAYPDGIPPEIMDGTVDHRQPYLGDMGLRWEPNVKYYKRIQELMEER